MTIKQKLFSGLFINILFIAALGFVSYYGVNKIDREAHVLAGDLAPAIIAGNELTRIFYSDVEEAFSYVVLDSTEERDHFYENAKRFEEKLDEFKALVSYGTPDAMANDTRLINAISAVEKDFIKATEELFSDYEKTKRINATKVNLFAIQVEKMVPLLKQFIDLGKAEIEQAHITADSTASTSNNLTSLALLIVLTLSLLVNWIVIRAIIKPLSELNDSVVAIGKGDFTKRTDVSSKDEFGHLASAFNVMTENVQRLQETKIAERTSGLKSEKTDLERIVVERTADLNKKLAELERANRLMVDRELKMIELKKENEILKAQKG